MATKKNDVTTVSIPAMDIREFDLRIVGDTPLISHAWDEKAKLMMLNKQMKNGDLLRGLSISYEVVDRVLHFFVTYNMMIGIPKKLPIMKTLHVDPHPKKG